MRLIGELSCHTSLVLVTRWPPPVVRRHLDVNSAVDAYVYPDGASVTLSIAPRSALGRHTLVAKDFPLTLDPSSLRVESEVAQDTIGAIDARPPAPGAAVNLSEIDKRIEALKTRAPTCRARLPRRSAAQIAERFAEPRPRPRRKRARRARSPKMAHGSRRSPRKWDCRHAIREANASSRYRSEIRASIRSQHQAARQARGADRFASAAATKATLKVTYAVRNARWMPLYDAPRHRRKGPQARDRTGAPRRDHAIDRRDWSNVTLGVSTVRVARGAAAGPQFADRISAAAATDGVIRKVLIARGWFRMAPAPAASNNLPSGPRRFKFGGGQSFGEQRQPPNGAFQATLGFPAGSASPP